MPPATLFIRMNRRRARKSDRVDDKQSARSDTFAWLFAAVQVIGPILVVLILSVVLAYSLIHFVFLR